MQESQAMHSIGAAARLSGVPIETIRYYERIGVVPPPERAASGRRLYDDEGIVRLRFVRRCRELGLPLDDVRTLLALAAGESGVCKEVRVLGERHLRGVRARMADLQRLEVALVGLLADCERGETDCPALRRLFAA